MICPQSVLAAYLFPKELGQVRFLMGVLQGGLWQNSK